MTMLAQMRRGDAGAARGLISNVERLTQFEPISTGTTLCMHQSKKYYFCDVFLKEVLIEQNKSRIMTGAEQDP